jgi:hypothetical protein
MRALISFFLLLGIICAYRWISYRISQRVRPPLPDAISSRLVLHECVYVCVWLGWAGGG